jgi:hypothetical protein
MPDQSGAGGDPPIIITGGSVTVNFGTGHGNFQHDGHGKHHNADKTIKRIVVKGGGPDIDRAIADGKVTIEVHYD